MRHLRNLAIAIGLATVLAALCACAGREGAQSAPDVGGGTVAAPSAAGTQPPEGTPANPQEPSTMGTDTMGAGGTAGSGTATGGSATETGAGATAGAAAAGGQPDCTAVLCQTCPEGQTPAMTPGNCCRCVPLDRSIKTCDNVRCAACPEGQRPALKPPDCCRCVPI